jgi:hypothetical protein
MTTRVALSAIVGMALVLSVALRRRVARARWERREREHREERARRRAKKPRAERVKVLGDEGDVRLGGYELDKRPGPDRDPWVRLDEDVLVERANGERVRLPKGSDLQIVDVAAAEQRPIDPAPAWAVHLPAGHEVWLLADWDALGDGGTIVPLPFDAKGDAGTMMADEDPTPHYLRERPQPPPKIGVVWPLLGAFGVAISALKLSELAGSIAIMLFAVVASLVELVSWAAAWQRR